MLWYEAVDQLKAGQTLRAQGRAKWSNQKAQVRLQRQPEQGWVIEDWTRPVEDPDFHTLFDRLELALLEFERRVGSHGLLYAVSNNRYAYLFPTGSSLGWSPKPLIAWRPRPLPVLLFRCAS